MQQLTSPRQRGAVAGHFQLGSWLVQPDLNATVRDGKAIHLTPKVMGVLVCLAEHAGNPVSKEELIQTVWPNTFVTDDVLKGAISELRRAFGDDAREPRIIQTIPKRGYRLIAAVEPVASQLAHAWPALRVGSLFEPTKRHSVGRAKERSELAAAFQSAVAGHGSLVCVAGEPGIGKTTLVQDFLSDLQGGGKSFGLGIGRCSQRLAGEEAYLPFLEALESLLRGDAGLTRRLRDLAPSWYAQLFPLSESDDSDAALQVYARATTQERVKRELTAFLCEITRQSPLVLFFDDVHWTDPSTVDLLSHLATKFEGTKILVIVTYRPSELLLLKHPFVGVKRELQAHCMCREIEVEFLLASDVERYIGLEFLGNCFPREFAGLIHARTEGNPLFMVDLLRYLRDRKVIVKANGNEDWRLAQSLPDLSRAIPQSVGSVIERKVGQLSDRDREVLTAAAVQGHEFDSATVARGLEAEDLEIEEVLDQLNRVHGFVGCVGEHGLPSGPTTVRYRFVHVLYQNALYASLTPTRRAVLSASLAHALEAFYGERCSTIASQLGFLYETAREVGRAADYFCLAAQNAGRIFAYHEAIALARRGLLLLEKTPHTPDRTRKELDLQLTLAISQQITRGYWAQETAATITRARELCQHLGDPPELSPVLSSVWLHYLGAPELQKARETAESFLDIARRANDPNLLVMAHVILGVTMQHQGELAGAHGRLEAALRYHDPAKYKHYLELYGLEPGIYGRSETVRTLWMLGYPDQARRRAEETLALARTIPSPPASAFIHLLTAILYQHLRQPGKARQMAEACIAICDEHGVAMERGQVMFHYGWAIAELGQVENGISMIRTALDAQCARGGQINRPHKLACLAEVHCHAGQSEEGLKAVEEGLSFSRRTGNCHYDAELWRLKGEFLKMQGKTVEAEDCFQKAIEIARQQAAKSFELLASTSLARLWENRGKRKEAHQLLSDIYAWFTEGFDTADLQDAASLLKELC